MSEGENWSKYGFPDGLTFRSPYLPWLGLIKALNERRQAVNLEPFPAPDYFTAYGGMYWESDFLRALYAVNEIGMDGAAHHYVNPDKISSASQFKDCFWTGGDLQEAGLDGEEMSVVTSIMRPQYSVKWAIWVYNQINLLRYVPTSDPEDWPDIFTYTDISSTFNFKA